MTSQDLLKLHFISKASLGALVFVSNSLPPAPNGCCPQLGRGNSDDAASRSLKSSLDSLHFKVAARALHTVLTLLKPRLLIIFLHLLHIVLHISKALLSREGILIEVLVTALPGAFKILARTQPRSDLRCLLGCLSRAHSTPLHGWRALALRALKPLRVFGHCEWAAHEPRSAIIVNLDSGFACILDITKRASTTASEAAWDRGLMVSSSGSSGRFSSRRLALPQIFTSAAAEVHFPRSFDAFTDPPQLSCRSAPQKRTTKKELGNRGTRFLYATKPLVTSSSVSSALGGWTYHILKPLCR